MSVISINFQEGDGKDVTFGLRKCNCGLDAKLKTSTAVRNPGRRFYGCPNFMKGNIKGCGYFKWVDNNSIENEKEEAQWSCIVQDLVKALEKKEDDICYLRYILGIAIFFV
ncbi:hypothetical protein Ddye_020628 [Dipteronia dyeriana]|uniref:GRF-type domain-containing protein n=1 Tax=Dipteronia dyeriana TaxID=168575 RepID=A0AAD9U0I9_9ROSI|nr:hypothetical protein Ddye_020628 [Dipteronia dyeriana]